MRPETVGRAVGQAMGTLLLMAAIVSGIVACATGSGWAWLAFLVLAGVYSWATYPAVWWVRR
jgi:hypothetical protein